MHAPSLQYVNLAYQYLSMADLHLFNGTAKKFRQKRKSRGLCPGHVTLRCGY